MCAQFRLDYTPRSSVEAKLTMSENVRAALVSPVVEHRSGSFMKLM
jgi:hypothetical protein